MVSHAIKVLLGLVLAVMAVTWYAPMDTQVIALGAGFSVITSAFIGYAVFSFRPERRLITHLIHPDPWMLIGTSLVITQLVHLQRATSGNLTSVPHGRLEWLLTMVATLFCAYALIQIMRHRFGERARDHVVESLILAGTCSMLIWSAILEPLAIQAGIPITSQFPAAMAVFDTLIIASLSLYIVTSFDRRQSAFWYLAVGQVLPVLGVLLGHVGTQLGALELIRAEAALVPLSLGFIGIGALDSSMAQFEEPTGPAGARLGHWRLATLVAPIVMGPLLLLFIFTDRIQLSPLPVAIYTISLAVFVVGHLIAMVQARATSTHWASHDKLTGLPNRALFRERTAQALERSRKFGNAVAVMYLDLDRFKHINDSMGHEAGDQLLEQVARRILTCVDPSDTVARLGGDEFAILLPNVENDRVPRMLAHRLLKTFSAPFQLKPRPVFMSPSIGISIGDGSIALEALLTQADTAMYRTKESGRNNFAVWTHEMNEESHQRLLLETHLHSAIANDQLRLVYQPKVSLSTGAVVGVEALIRWHHPKLGVISPGVFIHLAEESGLINQIGEWVLETACTQGKLWADAGFPNLQIAVNLSSRQFQNQNVATLVAHILRTTELDPALLELELTESLAMSGDEATVSTLLELREMGVTTAIDDFGTGYSNLSYLSRFPIDKLKIDRAFIEQIDKSGGDAAIVVAIIAMAHGLGLKVIAEGVETNDQANFLAQQGCDEMQGFLFSKPLPPNELEALLMLENVATGPGRYDNAQRHAPVASPPMPATAPMPAPVTPPPPPPTPRIAPPPPPPPQRRSAPVANAAPPTESAQRGDATAPPMRQRRAATPYNAPPPIGPQRRIQREMPEHERTAPKPSDGKRFASPGPRERSTPPTPQKPRARGAHFSQDD